MYWDNINIFLLKFIFDMVIHLHFYFTIRTFKLNNDELIKFFSKNLITWYYLNFNNYILFHQGNKKKEF